MALVLNLESEDMCSVQNLPDRNPLRAPFHLVSPQPRHKHKHPSAQDSTGFKRQQHCQRAREFRVLRPRTRAQWGSRCSQRRRIRLFRVHDANSVQQCFPLPQHPRSPSRASDYQSIHAQSRANVHVREHPIAPLVQASPHQSKLISH